MSSDQFILDNIISCHQYQVELGELIRLYRNAKKMTQEELGRYCHKTKQQISDIETGKVLIDSYSYDIIERVLGIPHTQKPLFIQNKLSLPTTEQVQAIELVKQLPLDNEITKDFIQLLIKLTKKGDYK